MQKVSYMGNGSTTEFYFNFPYFENSNVVVTKNNQTATGYNVIGNSGGLDADIPYTGGKVVFDVAPRALDCIVIARQLPMARVADYQPLAQINPTTLNQDLNYLMEVIKDRKDELDELCTQYSEIADKESTETLLARISAIHDEIVEIDAKITALGDVSQIRNDITTLKGYDYVIESQTPTAQNNYTWYRKYKSGWVEQGGNWVLTQCQNTGTMVTININLPITMCDKWYYASPLAFITDGGNTTGLRNAYIDKTTEILSYGIWNASFGTNVSSDYRTSWYVCGYSL